MKMKVLKKKTKAILLKNTWLNYVKLSFSQYGEDMLIATWFSRQEKGFFIDIGAHHPYRFSNTYGLYRRGWRGINVDILPGSISLFKKKRPRDINLECGVSRKSEVLKYYHFKEPAYNTFDSKLAKKRIMNNVSDLIETKTIKTVTLKKILEANLTKNQEIDLLTVDVEGLDLDVLMSNDWSKYRPKVVVAEVSKLYYETMNSDPIVKLMKEKGYIMVCVLHKSAFFIDCRSKLGKNILNQE